MSIKKAIGLMSGTSMDGIDVALIETDGERIVNRKGFSFFEYDTATVDLIKLAIEDAKGCTRRDERLGVMADAEKEITDQHIDAVNTFLEKQDLKPQDIDIIGFHGQTVLHKPDIGMTIQLGDGESLAQNTGIKTVYDMRANDMQHGGQGAPLVPIYHQALAYTLPDKFKNMPVIFVNIGGISNISFVGEELIAFDTGPGNNLIDQWVHAKLNISYDENGAIGQKGEVNEAIANAYLAHPFFDMSLPKSLDRSDFSPLDDMAISVEDGARTLAFITAKSIIQSQKLLPQTPQLWVIMGGGRHNVAIMNDLKYLAQETGTQVSKAEDLGFNGDAVEAQSWGYLAVRSLADLPLTLPMTTGVKQPQTGGVLAVN